MKIWQTLALTVLVTIPSWSAGLYIVEESRTPGKQTADTSRISLEHDRAAIESTHNGSRQLMIYRSDRGMFYLADPEKGTYRQFSKEDMKRMAGQLGDAAANMRKVMDERMKNMTPQQRAMVEQMMNKRMGGAMLGTPAKIEKTVYRRAGPSQKVRQWNCDPYEGYRGQEHALDVCAAAWGEIDARPGDFQVFRDLTSMFESLSSKMGVDMFPVGDDENLAEGRFPGIPVRWVHYANGQVNRTSEIVEVSRKDFDPAIFELKPGWKRLKTPGLGAPQGR